MSRASALPVGSWRHALLWGGGLGLGLALLDALVLTRLIHDTTLTGAFILHLAFNVPLFIGLGTLVLRVIERRRQTEDELRKLSRAVEQSPSTVVITDLDGNIEYVNPKFTKLTGYTFEEVRGQNPRILKSGTMPPGQYAAMWKTIIAGEEWRGEFHNVRKDGELFWEMASISAIRNSEGVNTHYLKVTEDITARKKAEVAEREQRALNEALRDIAAAINETLDLDLILDRLLANLSTIAPHDGADFMLIRDGMASVVRVCHQMSTEDQAALLALELPVASTPHLSRMMRAGEPLVVGDMSADLYWSAFPFARAHRSYASVPICNKGEARGFVSLYAAALDFFTPEHLERLQTFASQAAIAIQNAEMYDDVRGLADQLSERVAERTAALERQQAQLQATLDSMAEGVAYVQDGFIRYTNPVLETMLGAGPGDLARPVGEIFARYIRANDEFENLSAHIIDLYQQGRIWRGQVQVCQLNGIEFDAELTVTPVYAPDGQRIGSVAVLHDISQEKVLEAQKNQFLAHAAHELRTPISNIKTRLYLLRRQPEQLTDHIAVLDRVTDDLIGLIEDLLDVVRFERKAIRLSRQTLVLQALVREAISARMAEAERHGVWLAYELPDEPLAYNGDWRRLTQVLVTLIANAIHYTPQGSHVLAQLAVEEGHALIRIHDSGSGIAEDKLPYVFQPFFLAREGDSENLGLGLAIAQQIVDLHGGTLSAESVVGQGSVFTVRLALSEDHSSPEWAVA